MSANMMGSGKVAELVGVPRHRLIWLLDTGRVPEPALKLPGRRLFSSQDVERIREAMDKMKAKGEAQTVGA